MKILLTIAAAAVLAGCATSPPSRNYPTTYAPPPADQSQWHVVSVTPVPPGTRDRYAQSGGNGSSVQYSSAPIATYAQQPTYAPRTYYTPPSVYLAPPMYAPPPAYYYPPVSIGLDFMFGRSWGGRRGHRNWGGVGIGSRWHR